MPWPARKKSSVCIYDQNIGPLWRVDDMENRQRVSSEEKNVYSKIYHNAVGHVGLIVDM